MKPDTTFAIHTAPKRNSRHWKPGRVTWAEILAWTDTVSLDKESGGYVLGTLAKSTRDHGEPGTAGYVPGCVQYHRLKESVVSRGVLCLDADYATPDLPENVELLTPWAALVHTTYSSAPDAPRYRMLFPLDREVSATEYAMLAEVVMARFGVDQFDLTSVQAERYMFKPSAQHDRWFQSWKIDGDPLPVDQLLGEYDPDLSRVPLPAPPRGKRDPFTLEGVVGAFNRSHTIEEAIAEYALPYDMAGGGRWSYRDGHGAAGMGVIGEGLAYSHHSTDPAHGEAVTAFDLVRLHLFGHLDDGIDLTKVPINRRPSHTAMIDQASISARVVAELVGVDFNPEGGDGPDDWKLRFRLSPRSGKFMDCVENWDLVMDNDPVFTRLSFNEMNFAVEVTGAEDLPWRPVHRGGPIFVDADRAALWMYLEREYHVRPSKTLLDDMVNVVARRRHTHPVRDWLDGLQWDGTPRLDTCLPGVTPTDYTRMVARKALVAAVARIYQPGVKWDHVVVLFGPEGMGKSWWVDRMARGYSATLGRIGDKDTLLTMQRSWIMLADEGHSLRKADADQMKEFLTRTVDVFRLPFERDTLAHPRRCVIWSSTNDEVFLRRAEGNRRYLIVRSEGRVDFDQLTDEYVDQVWAEALHYYRAGERLFLDDVERDVAAEQREEFTEEDALGGLIEHYLETRVPEDWPKMGVEARKLWLFNRDTGFEPDGTLRQDEVCSAQIWAEALNRPVGQARRQDLLDITNALRRIPGWRTRPGRHRLPGYGPQLVWERIVEDDLEDLI